MRKFLAVALSALTLTACSTDIPVSSTWQITNVYVKPDTPSNVPEPAYLVFGETSVTGSTGCAQIQGRVSFSPSYDAPTSISFRDMNFEETHCEGSQRYFHDQLVVLLSGEMAVKKQGDEMLLSKTGELDKPGVRLVASN